MPVHDDRLLFAFLVLEGFQAGLSWRTILNKRPNFTEAFDHFNPELIARYDERKIAELLTNPGIVRNRLKINATVNNARCFLDVRDQFGSFDAYQWQFVDGRPIQNNWKSLHDVPAHSPESDAMSKDMIQRGFRFVGPTICYAHMQAVGMVNDHTIDCFRYLQVRLLT